MTRNIKLTISYDGTDFHGWQRQSNDRSVQGEIEKVLAKIEKENVPLTGAGRTDSGVHATGQCANFVSRRNDIALPRYRDALNAHLPFDVRILEAEEVPKEFHSRYSACERYYKYFILSGDIMLPMYRNYALFAADKLSLPRLNQIVAPLIGIHDFTSFSAAGDANENKVREIRRSVFLQEGPFLVYYISGNAFLWKMVRSIVGTVLMLHKEGGELSDMVRILDARDRGEGGATASPKGLFLTGVRYDNPETLRRQKEFMEKRKSVSTNSHSENGV